MEAQVNMTGWVGSEVDFRQTQATGTSRASFRLACTPRVRRNGSWTDDPTTWLTVTCWRSLADHVASSLGKGEPVLVIGRLRTQAWEDDQGGKHERLVLDATNIGHDLSKGTAAFRRAHRERPENADRPEPGTQPSKAETTQGAAAGTDAGTDASETSHPTSGGSSIGDLSAGQAAVAEHVPT